MKKRYAYTFQFFKTEEEASDFCTRRNRSSNHYIKQTYPAHYTPWNSQNGKENAFVAWYVENRPMN